MAGNVAGQKAQEPPEHRIVFLGNFHAGEYDLTVGPDRVVNFVPLTQPQGATSEAGREKESRLLFLRSPRIDDTDARGLVGSRVA